MTGILGRGKLLFSKWGTRSLVRKMSDYPAIRSPHMNDVPFPEKFEHVYAQRQRGNNALLLFGITFFSLTFYTVSKSGVLFNNPMPPKKLLD